MLEEIKKMIVELEPEIDASDITESTMLIDDLGMDSVTMYLLFTEMEDHFGCRFSDDDVFDTVGELCEYLKNNA